MEGENLKIWSEQMQKDIPPSWFKVIRCLIMINTRVLKIVENQNDWIIVFKLKGTAHFTSFKNLFKGTVHLFG